MQRSLPPMQHALANSEHNEQQKGWMCRQTGGSMQGSLPGRKQPVPARSRPTQLRQMCVKPWRISLPASRRCSTLLGTVPVSIFLQGHHHLLRRSFHDSAA